MSWSFWVNINIFLNFANYRGDFWGQVAVFQSTLVNSWHSRPSSSRPSEQSISVCPIAFVKIFIYSSKLAILSNSTTWKSFLISKRDSSGIIYNLSSSVKDLFSVQFLTLPQTLHTILSNQHVISPSSIQKRWQQLPCCRPPLQTVNSL